MVLLFRAPEVASSVQRPYMHPGKEKEVLQKLYSQHWQEWYDWTATTPLPFRPATQDPQLVNGAALPRAGRAPAANFAKLPPASCLCGGTQRRYLLGSLCQHCRDFAAQCQPCAPDAPGFAATCVAERKQLVCVV